MFESSIKAVKKQQEMPVLNLTKYILSFHCVFQCTTKTQRTSVNVTFKPLDSVAL